MLVYPRLCLFVSVSSVKPGIAANVILSSSSSSMACSMAFNLASAIAAFLFAARTALSCTNFAKWDRRLLPSSASISILSRSFSANNRSNSASCLAAAASAKAFLRALDEEEWRDDEIRERERFPDVCDTESTLSLKSGSSMEFLPFSCEEDDLAALELLSMTKISQDRFTNTVLVGGVPSDIVRDSNSTLVLKLLTVAFPNRALYESIGPEFAVIN